jgi:protein phosphatase
VIVTPDWKNAVVGWRTGLPDAVFIVAIAVLVFALVYRWSAATPPSEVGTKKKSGSAKPESAQKKKPVGPELPNLATLREEDEPEVDPTKVGAVATEGAPAVQAPTKTILADEDAEVDEPTHGGALILVTGIAQTDKGLRRKRNEDSVLSLPDHGVYVVADGMGGYRGGEIASALAVKGIEQAFRSSSFAGSPHKKIPKRASELARAIQMANDAILRRAAKEKELAGMGTTLCAARFSANKQRLYVGHVGDSRMYRLRDGKLSQLTSDHTMKDLGVTGDGAAHLSRAVGIWPTVPIDIILCKPRPRDVYLLCSDGLNKMLSDAKIGQILDAAPPPKAAMDLIAAANESGGKDNVSVIVIRVDDPLAAALAAPERVDLQLAK